MSDTATVEIEIDFKGDDSTPPAGRVVIIEASSDSGLDRHETTIVGSTPQEIRIAKGTWRIQARTEGYWSPELALLSPGWGHVKLRLPMYPTARIKGELRFERPPEETKLTARFVPPFRSGSSSKGDSPLKGTVRCETQIAQTSVTDDPNKQVAEQFICNLPIGLHDIRVRAEGFSSHFFWKLEVEKGNPGFLGILPMRKGASLVGFVESEGGEPIENASIRLSASGEEADSAPFLGVSGSTNSRGFFHLEGIRAGIFRLQVEAGGFLPSSVSNLAIRKGAEAELTDPLVMKVPATLAVRLVPPLDPDGHPWSVKLLDRSNRGKKVAGRANKEGVWTTDSLSPGEYDVIVQSGRARFKGEPIVLTRNQPEIVIELPLTVVEGSVRLGDQPLEAKVVFGSIQGVASVSLMANRDGLFEGILPEKESWDIDVMATEPRVFRRFRNVTASAEDDGVISFDLELPDTELSGIVVDASGKPIPSSDVTALKLPFSELPSFVSTDAIGEFSFRGMSFGNYRFEAEAQLPDGTDLEGRPVNVELTENAPTQTIRIVLARATDFGGRVSSQGVGVPAAQVLVRGMDIPSSRVLVTRTDRGGYFKLSVPSETRRVTLDVQAAGLVLQRRSIILPLEEPVRVDLEHSGGGTLALEFAESLTELSSANSWPHIELNGLERFSLPELIAWSSANGTPGFNGTSLRIPFMPAGHYRICWSGGLKCREGDLIPEGTLNLELGRESTNSESKEASNESY